MWWTVIAIAVAGLLFGRDAVTSQVMSSFKEMLASRCIRGNRAFSGRSRYAIGATFEKSNSEYKARLRDVSR